MSLRTRKSFFSHLLLGLVSAVIFQLLTCVTPAAAQSVSPNPAATEGATSLRIGQVSTNYGMQQNLLVTVLNQAKSHLDRQSVIALHDLKRNTTVWQTTSSDSQAIFYDLDFGDYDVEVSAVGYKTEHKKVHVTYAIQSPQVEVTLEKDPTAVDLNANDDLIPPKQRKDAKRAVSDLKSGKLKDAQKRLDKVYPFAPKSAQLNFLYGYLFLQQKDLEKSESYLKKAAALDPRRAQTFIELGRVQLFRQHYSDAQTTLEQAVADDSNSWLAHNFLAAAYLKQRQYEKAQQQAQLAINEGKGPGSAAQLILGQALANLGHDQEGIQALNAFLQANPNDPLKSQVQSLITEIQHRDAEQAKTPHQESIQLKDDLALAASEPSLPLSTWGPPGVDEVKPTVASGVACPVDQVLQMSGLRVKQLVDNISKFSATEDLLHEQLDQYGNPLTRETRKFDYVAWVAESPTGYFSFDENRNVRYGIADLPDHIVTAGFVSLALIFHPDIQPDYQMTCEGLGQWQGQATWLVYFQQRDKTPARIEDYKVGNESYPIKLKGRAWITADNFQIVRIESELMNSVPQLAVQHQIVDYGPVHFQRKNVDLWLPKSVDIYLELNKHRYYRRHSFDHYMLFSVNSEDKLPVLKTQDKAPPLKNDPENDPLPKAAACRSGRCDASRTPN